MFSEKMVQVILNWQRSFNIA